VRLCLRQTVLALAVAVVSETAARPVTVMATSWASCELKVSSFLSYAAATSEALRVVPTASSTATSSVRCTWLSPVVLSSASLDSAPPALAWAEPLRWRSALVSLRWAAIAAFQKSEAHGDLEASADVQSRMLLRSCVDAASA